MEGIADELPQRLISHVGFVQLSIAVGQIEKNLDNLQKEIALLNPPMGTLLVLPELWGTGFAYQELPALENKISSLYDELQIIASAYDILLAGSLPEKIDGVKSHYFNTLKIVTQQKIYGDYRKHHVFPGEEIAFYPSPVYGPPIETPRGRFGCMICYDLRFPDIARHHCQQGADLLLCAAQWPATRINQLRSLAIARAIENQTYLVLCNGLGGVDQSLGGTSLIISPDGEILLEGGMEPSGKIIKIDWLAKKTSQLHFKSYPIQAFHFPAKEKILTPEECAKNTELRCQAGQRVVFCRLKHKLPLTDLVNRLEKLRMKGDHLIVGIDSVHQEEMENQYAFRELQYFCAALASVGNVFQLGTMAPATERQIARSSLEYDL